MFYFMLGGDIQKSQKPLHLNAPFRLYHTELQPCLDFWLAPEAPMLPGGHMDPNKLEFENLKILSACPPEILTP